MWPDRVSNSGPLAFESDALPTALRGPAVCVCIPIVMSPVGAKTITQSTLLIYKSKGPSETLRDIRTSTYMI